MQRLIEIRVNFRPGHVLRREPGAFPALDKTLRDPALCEVRLAEAPAAPESLEAMGFQGPIGSDLAGMQWP